MNTNPYTAPTTPKPHQGTQPTLIFGNTVRAFVSSAIILLLMMMGIVAIGCA